MGQYWYVVNLDRREFVMPHRIGTGLKLWEQLANHPGTGAALIVLCAAMPEARGGGDFDLETNWHGPDRVDFTREGPALSSDYRAIAARTIGRWAGDRIALIGDYADDGDLGDRPLPCPVSKIMEHCSDPGEIDDADPDAPKPDELWADVTADVRAVIEHELGGRYEGDGWMRWVPKARGSHA